MPLIEELPVTSTIKASHGWAYVPDTGPIAAQQPGTRDRKRAAATSSKHAISITAKQQKSIQQRLDSLNKENYKDGVTVPIPIRQGHSAREKAGRKMTSNVRRILTYQRGFAHYLADEEANNPGGVHYLLPSVAVGMAPPPVPVPVAPSASTPVPVKAVEAQVQKTSAKEDGRRRSGLSRTRASMATSEPSSPALSTSTTERRSKKRTRADSSALAVSSQKESEDQMQIDANPAPSNNDTESNVPVKSEDKPQDHDADTTMTNTSNDPNNNPNNDPNTLSSLPKESNSEPDYPPTWDNDPLLSTSPNEVPRLPTDKIMKLLISEPPLTYTAARATPLDLQKQRPPRRFCGVCGYWGRVRCKKCEEWTCGVMECWRGHEGVCVMAGMY